MDWSFLLALGYRIRQEVSSSLLHLHINRVSNLSDRLPSFNIRYIPIIASVSEHQPTAWPAFFMDLNILIWIFPAGVLLCFRELRDEHIFVIIYSVFATYFTGVMVRLMLTLTPCVCVASAVAVSTLFDIYVDVKEPVAEDDEGFQSASAAAAELDGGPMLSDSSSQPSTLSKKKGKKAAKETAAATTLAPPTTAAARPPSRVAKSSSKKETGIFGLDTRLGVVINTTFLLLIFVVHCTWVTSNAYSSPSVVLATRNPDGSQNIIDDFREAYYWIRQNTKEDAVIMSWWDYGYQIAGFADRPTLVDNNTWNNST